MSIASNANDFIQYFLSPDSRIFVDAFIFDEVGVGHARKDFSKEGDRLLPELLRVADIAEGDLIKRETYMKWEILLSPFLIFSFMVLARVGTTPLTAYSASTRVGFTSVQKKPSFLAVNWEAMLSILFIHDGYISQTGSINHLKSIRYLLRREINRAGHLFDEKALFGGSITFVLEILSNEIDGNRGKFWRAVSGRIVSMS